MAKLTLNDVTNLNTSSAATTFNNNNTLLEAALENTLSRDGSSPNTMSADIDMNGNDILNVNVLNATILRLAGTDITAESLSIPVNNSVTFQLSPSVFGAKGDGTTNDGPALMLAANAAVALKRELIIDRPYAYTSALTFNQAGLTIRGVGGWLQARADVSVTFSGVNMTMDHLVVDGLYSGANKITNPAIILSGSEIRMDDIRVNNVSGVGIDVLTSGKQIKISLGGAVAIRVAKLASGIEIDGQPRKFYNKPKFGAHRGLAANTGSVMQNTLYAFSYSYRMGARIWETDLQETSDKQLVLFHDDDVSVLTNGTGTIATNTLSTVQGWKFKKLLNTDMEDVRIPTLADFLALAQEYRPDELHIEYKNLASGTATIDSFMTALKNSGLTKSTLVYTGNGIEELEYTRQLDGDVQIMLFRSTIAEFTDDYLIRLSKMGKASVLVDWSSLTSDGTGAFIDKCHSYGVNVIYYTVNHYKYNAPLIIAGADVAYIDRASMSMTGF